MLFSHRPLRSFLSCVAFALLLSGFASSAAAQPTLSKVFTPDTIGPGSVSTITFTITNGSGSPVTGLAFTDVLPLAPGPMTIADPANASTTCDLGGSGSLTAPDGGGTITLSDAQIGGSSSCTVTVDVTASTPGLHTNPAITLTSSAGSSMSLAIDLTVVTTLPNFSKSFAPSSVSVGGRSTLTFTIDNTLNASRIGNLDFVDPLPIGLVVANPANASTDCVSASVPNTTLTAVPGSNSITLNADGSTFFPGFEVLPVGATCTVTVDVVTTGVGMLDNVTGELLADFVSAGKASATLTSTVTPLAITKSFTDDPVPPGANVTLEFELTNFDRNFAATGVAFTDDLMTLVPSLAGLTFSSLLENSCGGSVSGVGGTTISLTGGTIAPEASCTIRVSLAVPAGATPGSYTNTTSTITGTVDGSPVVGSAASDDLFVEPIPVLTKEFLEAGTLNPDPVVTPGDDVVLRFTITNTSTTSGATDVSFDDELTDGGPGTGFLSFPVPVTLPPVPDPPCGVGSSLGFFFPDIDRQGLRLTGGSLAVAGMAGDSCTFDVTVTIPADFPPGVYSNTTEQPTATVDGATRTGEEASDTLTVIAAPSLTKSFTDDPVAPGGTVTLEFTLSNSPNSPSAATDISFTDDLAALVPPLAGLTANLPPTPDPPCGPGSTLTGSAGDTLLTLMGGTLMPGEDCTFSVTLDVPMTVASGTYSNTTSGVSATVDGLPAVSPAASDDLDVGGMVFSKEFLADPVYPGQALTLRFNLENISAETATAIGFTDSLFPVAGLEATDPALADDCGGTLTVLTVPGLGSFLTYAGGTLAAGAACTVDVEVTVPATAADGVYENNAGNVSYMLGATPGADGPAIDDLVVDSDQLTLTKEFTDDPVAPGDSVTLEFTLTNLQAGAAVSAIDFSDDLGAALTGLVFDGVSFDDCGGTVGGTGTDMITVTGAAVGAGASCTLRVSLTVPGGAAAGVYTNTTSSVTGSIGVSPVTGDPASDDLDLVQLLQFSKSFDGPTTATGSATLTFTITNPGAEAAIALGFTDDLNAVIPGLIATSLPALPCGAGSSISGIGFLTFDGGELPPMGGTCSFDVDVLVPATATAGTFPNATSPLFSSGLLVSQPATADLVIEPPPTFTKVFSPDTVFTGQTSTLTFTIDNSASSLAATGLDVTDNLPAGLVVAPVANASTTCSGGTVTAVAGTTVITYTGGSVAAGATCTVQADVLTQMDGMLVNTTGDLTSSSGNSGPASDTLTVTSAADISVTKTDGVTSAVPGGQVIYTITVSNAGPSADPAATLTDTFSSPPLTCTYTSVAAGGASGNTAAGAGDLTETLSMPVGSSVTYTATCAIDSAATGTLSNTATATASVTDLVPGNNSATDGDTVLTAEADVSVTKDDGVTAAVPGLDTIIYAIGVANAGPSDDPAVALADTFPVALDSCTFTSVAMGGASGNTAAGSGDLAETLSLPAGSSVTYTATCGIDADATGTLSNTVTATTSVTDPDSGNNSATDGDTVLNAETDLSIDKSDGGLSGVAPGDPITYDLTVTNNGPSASTGATVTDVLPAGVTFGSSADCSEAGGTVTCAIGALAASDSTTVSFQVAVAPTQTTAIVNTATVAANEADGNSTNDSATVTTNLVPVFTKVFSDVSIELGAQSMLTFTIDNVGSTVAVTALAFTDNLPAQLEVSALPATVNGCGGTLTAVAGTSVIDLMAGTVAAGASCTIDVGVVAVGLGTANNVTSDLISSLGSSGAATADLEVVERPTTTNAADETVLFSDADQPVTLTATVSSTVPVDQGAVTFSVFDGVTPVGTPVVSGTVVAGAASAVFTLPATTPVGVYTIQADYAGGTDFAASSGSGTLTVEENIPGDKDGDGVDSLTEDGAPNAGDGNDDGIADRLQSTVTSLPSATTGDYVTVISNGAGCRNELVQTLDPADFPADATVVATYAQLQGLVGFELTCGAAEVTVIFHGETDLSFAEYRKFGPTPTDTAPHWYTLGATFGTAVVGTTTVASATFDLVDGQEGDNDITVDGRIVDPGGAAIRGVGIPTAGTWALILLAIALAGAAVGGLRMTR